MMGRSKTVSCLTESIRLVEGCRHPVPNTSLSCLPEQYEGISRAGRKRPLLRLGMPAFHVEVPVEEDPVRDLQTRGGTTNHDFVLCPYGQRIFYAIMQDNEKGKNNGNL